MGEVLVEALAGERRGLSRAPFFLRPGFASPIVSFCAFAVGPAAGWPAS